jgi:flagellar basal-body rod protein FlgF
LQDVELENQQQGSFRVKGIYSPLSGALAQERYLEVIANNLANINTTGYKADTISFSLLDPEPYKHYNSPLPPANYKQDLSSFLPPRGNDIQYVGVGEVGRDMSQGSIVQTGNHTDVMIKGNGYLSIYTKEGIRHSRDGSLAVNADGILVHKSGSPVLGERGNIQLRGLRFEVNQRGEIFQEGKYVDRLLIQDTKNQASFERVGDNLLFYNGHPDELTNVENAEVIQGMLEGSNVNAIKSMTSMIMAHRSYEAYQKALKHFDQLMEKSSNTIGEVRA